MWGVSIPRYALGCDGPCGGFFVVQVSPSGGCSPCVVRFSSALSASLGRAAVCDDLSSALVVGCLLWVLIHCLSDVVMVVGVSVAGFSGIDRGPCLSARVVLSAVSDWLLRLGLFVGLCSACCRRVSSSLVWEVSLYLFSVRALVAGVSCTVTAWIDTGTVWVLVTWLG